MVFIIFLVIHIIILVARSSTKVIINPTVHECIERNSELYCNFKDSDTQEVYLNPLGGQMKNIFVQHIKKLHLAASVCENVNFYNISEIVTEGETSEQCKEGFELLAVNSSLNKLPESVKTVFLKYSKIEVLASNENLEKLIVDYSEIATLRISGRFNKNAHVEMQGSRIVKTEQIVFEDKAELILRDSTFEKVPESIVLNPGVTVTLDKVPLEFFFTNSHENGSTVWIAYSIIILCFTGIIVAFIRLIVQDRLIRKLRTQLESRNTMEDNTEEKFITV